MSAVAAGVAGAAAVLLAALVRGPQRGRPIPRPVPTPLPGARRLERFGSTLARRLGAPTDPASARLLGGGVLAGAVLAPLVPAAAVVLPSAAWARATLRERQRRRAEERTILRSLPDAVDLLLLCTGAGTGLALAHRAVAARVDGPVGAALGRADQLADRGTPRADALVASLGPLGERPAALAHVLADHLRYGAPLAPELDRIGLELRLHRRRRAEEEARRVPVRLLAPLVSCTLPAFALLTVAPLLIASLQQLPT